MKKLWIKETVVGLAVLKVLRDKIKLTELFQHFVQDLIFLLKAFGRAAPQPE